MGAPVVVAGRGGVMDASARDRRISLLFDHHYRPMCRLAYVILGDGAQAEEIVMEAMLKTFSGWWRIRDPDNAHVYLKRTVVNLCRSKIRRKAVEARFLASSRPSSPTFDHDRLDVAQDVWRSVLELPERQRAAVVLRYFEDLSERDIADILDCSVGTVKSQLSKARAKLNKALGESVGGGRS